MRPAFFWTIATIMAGLTTAAILIPLLWKRKQPLPIDSNSRRIWATVALTTLLPLVALGFYGLFGAPQLLGTAAITVAADVGAQKTPTTAMPTEANGGDLADAVRRLKSKLAANPQDAAGWELLAQAYDFAGNSTQASDARSRAAKAMAGETVAPPTVDLTLQAAATLAAPSNSADASLNLAEKAEMHRRKREFPQALAAFAELARTQKMSADMWADYADAHGASQGNLDRTSAGYIAKALALDPKHIKALWLLGSYQTDLDDYRAAQKTWETLSKLLPEDSSDYRIISANLAEARSRIASPPLPITVVARQSAGAVRGVVDVAARFKSRAPRGSTLFVFAKEANAAGPPVAVMRLTVSAWPVSFQLDDTQAMIPTRKLSQFSSVVIEARISRSGDAQAQVGDLRAASKTVDPRTAGPIRLIINDEIT